MDTKLLLLANIPLKLPDKLSSVLVEFWKKKPEQSKLSQGSNADKFYFFWQALSRPSPLEVISLMLTGHVYWFNIVAVTNHHKLSGLKQQEFIILEFWRSEVPNPCHWAEMKVWAGCISFGGIRGGSLPLLAFPSWVRRPAFLGSGPPFSTFKARSMASFLSSDLCSVLTFFLCSASSASLLLLWLW